jgi:hypothetical protein
MRRAIGTILVAALVVLAGCSGATTGPDGSGAAKTTAQQTADEATTSADGTTGDSGGDSGSTAADGDGGTVNFYVSDERNAIDAFAHLNVTISKVGFQRGGESGEWIERDVDDATVDLTRLQGANATMLERFDLPNGTYTKVFVHVSEVNGTVDGEQVNVKLPSDKLHVNQQFEIGAGDDVDFVFDITVVEAGKSGKFVIKPVVSESGTDVPIEDVDEKDDDEKDDERGESDDLNAAFVGNVTAGANAGVEVTQNGSAVENATLSVDGEVVARTDANGTAAVPVPADAEEFEVEVRADDDEVELSRELTGESAEDDALEVELEDENVTDGEATVVVTREGDPVGNATVEVDGEVAGQTDADGRLDVAVSAGAEVTITVRTDGATATVELDVESE